MTVGAFFCRVFNDYRLEFYQSAFALGVIHKLRIFLIAFDIDFILLRNEPFEEFTGLVGFTVFGLFHKHAVYHVFDNPGLVGEPTGRSIHNIITGNAFFSIVHFLLIIVA